MNQMHLHRRLFRSDGLTLVSEKLDPGLGKYLRRLSSYGSIPRNEDPLRPVRLFKDPLRICGGNISVMPGYIAATHKDFQIHFFDGNSVFVKMERRIHMGTVVDAHGKSR